MQSFKNKCFQDSPGIIQQVYLFERVRLLFPLYFKTSILLSIGIIDSPRTRHFVLSKYMAWRKSGMENFPTSLVLRTALRFHTATPFSHKRCVQSLKHDSQNCFVFLRTFRRQLSWVHNSRSIRAAAQSSENNQPCTWSTTVANGYLYPLNFAPSWSVLSRSASFEAVERSSMSLELTNCSCCRVGNRSR